MARKVLGIHLEPQLREAIAAKDPVQDAWEQGDNVSCGPVLSTAAQPVVPSSHPSTDSQLCSFSVESSLKSHIHRVIIIVTQALACRLLTSHCLMGRFQSHY